MYKHILVPVDGSDPSRMAVAAAIELAQALGAKLSVYHACEAIEAYYFEEGWVSGPDVLNALQAKVREHGENLLAETKALAAAANVPCDTLLGQPVRPALGIIDEAENHRCDLIVMGSKGHGALVSLVLGSVTQKVLSMAKVPVLVIR